MPDEADYKHYSSIEEYLESAEASKYYHDLYLKAVNHPIRRQILRIINQHREITHKTLKKILEHKNILKDQNILNYHIDFLLKALCIEKDNKNGEIVYKITLSGQVVEYIKD